MPARTRRSSPNDPRRLHGLLYALPVLVATSCVPALHPLYTEQDLFLDHRILGAWTSADASRPHETLRFERLGDVGYLLTHTSEGRSGRFHVHLVRLAGSLFIDVVPDRRDLEAIGGGAYRQVIPAHTFGRIWIEGDRVRLAMLDEDWLRRGLRDRTVSLPHEQVDGTLVLTASTKQLQWFAVRFAADTAAWAQRAEFRRSERRRP